MATSTQPTAAGTIGKSHTVSRVFDAPRDLVWKAHTEPDHMARWFGPEGTECEVKKLELRVGGVFHYRLHGADGYEVWGKAVYREITPKDRMVFIQSFSDANEGITSHSMSPTWPREVHSTVTFEDLGNNKTRLSVEWAPFNATPEEQATFDATRMGVDEGWKGTFDKLAELLRSEQH